MSPHRVSVVMSVYNGQKHLKEAIESVLNQTFRDFEFIIVDDGSTDRTWEILTSYEDPRILLARNRENIGLTKSLNRGVEMVRGEYIARQDADDVSLPQRLSEQVRLLDDDQGLGLAGCSFVEIDQHGYELRLFSLPTSDDEIMARLVQGRNPFCHGAAIFREECTEAIGLYRERFQFAQDYDLWLRIGERYRLANLRQPLYKRRISPGRISTIHKSAQDECALLAAALAEERIRQGKDDLGAKLLKHGRNGLGSRKPLSRSAFFWARELYRRGKWSATLRMLFKCVRYQPVEGGRHIVSSLGRRMSIMIRTKIGT